MEIDDGNGFSLKYTEENSILTRSLVHVRTNIYMSVFNENVPLCFLALNLSYVELAIGTWSIYI